MAVDFGVIDHIDFQDIPIAQTFDERVEQVVRFEQDGFYAYHLTEHHFTPHGLASSPILFMAAVSRLTQTIKLVPTVLVLPTYHPLRLAEEICMIDQLSHGRFEFGSGRGIVPHELALFGINPAESGEMMAECLDVVMKALDNETVTHRGHYYRYVDVPMVIRPTRPFGGRGQWVVSGRAAAARAAGRAGDNILTMLRPDKARQHFAAYVEGWQETHGAATPTSKIGLTRHVFVAETEQEAVERGEFGFAGWFDNHSWMWNRYDHSRGRGDDSEYRNNKALIFGTPAQVREQLAADLDEAGPEVNYLVPRFAFGNLRQDEVLRSYRLFCDEVMPYLRQQHQQQPIAA